MRYLWFKQDTDQSDPQLRLWRFFKAGTNTRADDSKHKQTPNAKSGR